MRALVLILVVAVAVLGGIAMAQMRPPLPGQYRHAGITFDANDPQWGRVPGGSRLRVEMVPVRVSTWRRLRGLDGITFAELLTPLCTGLLADLPSPPPDLAPLYRIDMSMARRFSTSSDVVALRIRDGRCDPLQVQGRFHAPYPPPLEDWFVRSGEVKGGGRAKEVSVRFFRTGEREPQAEFAFAQACAALLADPPFQLRGMFQPVPPARLTVTAVNAAPSLVFVATTASMAFLTADRRCTPVGEGDPA